MPNSDTKGSASDSEIEMITIEDLLDQASARLIAVAFPDVAEGSEISEHEAVPQLLSVAHRLCDEGDQGVCALMRSWVWDGATTFLGDVEGSRVVTKFPELAEVRADYLIPSDEEAREEDLSRVYAEVTTSIAGHDERTVVRWHKLADEIGPAVPATWTKRDLARGRAIMKAEEARVMGMMAILKEIGVAYEQFPQARRAAEACRLAGLDMQDITRRLNEVPPPDSVGLQWLISEFERAQEAGTLLYPPA